MTRFVVLENGEGFGPDMVLLRDRFHAVAFLVPFLWLAAHRLYLFAALAFAVQAGLFALGRAEGFGLAGFVLTLLFGAAIALEGPRLVVWSLARRGYREAAVIHTTDLDEAELLYYGDAERPLAAEAVSEPAPTPPPARSSPRSLPTFGWRNARTLLDTGPR